MDLRDKRSKRKIVKENLKMRTELIILHAALQVAKTQIAIMQSQSHNLKFETGGIVLPVKFKEGEYT